MFVSKKLEVETSVVMVCRFIVGWSVRGKDAGQNTTYSHRLSVKPVCPLIPVYSIGLLMVYEPPFMAL